MSTNPYGSSLETRILSATSLELVELLYEGALEAVRAARQHLVRKDIRQRSQCVSKAVEIVAELQRSLDRSSAGELGPQLLALYDFIQRALLDANYRQEDEGLRQAEQLLATLHEAWVTLQRSAAPTAEPLYAPVGSAEPEYAGMHQWRA